MATNTESKARRFSSRELSELLSSQVEMRGREKERKRAEERGGGGRERGRERERVCVSECV